MFNNYVYDVNHKTILLLIYFSIFLDFSNIKI